MPSGYSKVAIVAFVGLVLCVAVAAQDAGDAAHPIFSDLEVGQRVSFRWEQGGYVISDSGGVNTIQELGSDYIVVSESGQTYFVYINQIKKVAIRPSNSR